MTNVTQKFAVLGLLTGLSAGLAQAEEVDISVGAHAFMDYENAAIDGEELVNGVNLRVFRVDLNGSKDNLTFKSNVDFAGDSVSIKDLFFEFSGARRRPAPLLVETCLSLGASNQPVRCLALRVLTRHFLRSAAAERSVRMTGSVSTGGRGGHAGSFRDPSQALYAAVKGAARETLVEPKS